MHLALPPRKNSNPAQYKPRTSRLRAFRRSRLKYVILCGLAIGAILFFLFRLSGGSERIPLGTPGVVIVTLIEPSIYGKQYISDIKENREEYAKRHGYACFHPQASDYDLNGAPPSWAKVPALRHAMAKYPYTQYFWLLDQNTLIMNPDLTIESIMDPKRLDALMIKDQPIVPPDSVIKTFGHLHGDQIDFVLTQDKNGLAPISFIVRRGDWAKFFLDTWFDPLYRSYNFQKAETHALEHIVQWHPTILSKLALVPQRIINSHSTSVEENSLYKEGDFVIHFNGCEKGTCETAAQTYSKQWRTNFHGAR